MDLNSYNNNKDKETIDNWYEWIKARIPGVNELWIKLALKQCHEELKNNEQS